MVVAGHSFGDPVSEPSLTWGPHPLELCWNAECASYWRVEMIESYFPILLCSKDISTTEIANEMRSSRTQGASSVQGCVAWGLSLGCRVLGISAV